jgi:AraC-like DNA-binding protein
MRQHLSDGSYTIADEIHIPGVGMSDFVFARGWLLEVLEVVSGEFYFFSDGQAIKPWSKRFAVFYPPFSIVRTYVSDFTGNVHGIGSVKLPAGLPSAPTIFDTDHSGPFTKISDAVRMIAEGVNSRTIEPNTHVSLLSKRAKRMIDENYLIYPSIAKVAARLGVSHAHLSRQFKRDYQMSPSKYLHQLRTAEAAFRLSMGDEIIDISSEVGYNDLSRFYKQFNKKFGMSPGRCRTVRSGSS